MTAQRENDPTNMEDALARIHELEAELADIRHQQQWDIDDDEDMFGEPRNPVDQINEHLGYDADVSDSSQYCRHGTFIGSWWGPDYLCHQCESE